MTSGRNSFTTSRSGSTCSGTRSTSSCLIHSLSHWRSRTQVNLRLALAWSGRYAHAMTGATDEDISKVLNNVGYVALLRGDFDNAEAYLLRAMEADPSFNKVAWRNLAYLRNIRDLKAADAEAGTAETITIETGAAQSAAE